MEVRLEERIEVDGFKGVTKFFGEIQGQPGKWVGIDWDCLSRGKHNGSVNSKRYFCARGEKTGSFVRSEVLNFGSDLMEEIVNKYVGNKEEDVLQALPSQDDKDARWELVQMEKIHQQQSNIRALKCIVLCNSLVSHVKPHDSNSLFQCCTELDLSSALLGRWSKVVQILRLFPVLRTLHLSKNRMEPLEDIDLSTLDISFPITQLSLSNCFLSELSANSITLLFKNLEEVYLADNQLKSYAPLGDCSKLQKVDLQGNMISDFSGVSKLSTLPSLEFLNLSNCGLKSVEFSAEDSQIGFAKLNTLFVQHNPALDRWSFIHELARLPALTKLVLRGVLLPGSRGMDSREMIITKMPNLTDLDRCDVSQIARRSAELLFLSRFGHFKSVEPEHKMTIERLEKIYGEMENNGSDNASGPRSPINISGIQSKRINLVYKEQETERNLSILLSIHKIVGLASRLFDFDPTDIEAVELRRKDYPVERLKRTKDDLLSRFDLADGDAIAFIESQC